MSYPDNRYMIEGHTKLCTKLELPSRAILNHVEMVDRLTTDYHKHTRARVSNNLHVVVNSRRHDTSGQAKQTAEQRAGRCWQCKQRAPDGTCR